MGCHVLLQRIPSPGDLPNLGIKPTSLKSPELVDEFFTTGTTWEVPPLAYEQFTTVVDVQSLSRV